MVDEALRQQGLDAVVCGAPPNILMLTGYWPVIGTSVSVQRADGSHCIILPADEAAFAPETGAVTYQPSTLDKLTTAREAIREPLLDALSSLARSQARIGIETSPVLVPAPYASLYEWGLALRELIQQLLPRAELVSADSMLSRLRARLTSIELHNVKHACLVAADAFAMGRAMIAPGATERGVAGTVQSGFVSADAARAGGFAYCMTGPNSAHAGRAYAYSGVRRIDAGDLVLIHCNSYVNGFWTDITRTYSVGTITDQKRILYDVVLRARDRALECIRPGVASARVDNAVRACIAESGYGTRFPHATGHGVGFAAIDHNAIPRLHPASADTLEPGMVFNMEPAIYIEGFGGIRHCDVVAVTEHGAEVLTPFHSELADLELT